MFLVPALLFAAAPSIIGNVIRPSTQDEASFPVTSPVNLGGIIFGTDAGVPYWSPGDGGTWKSFVASAGGTVTSVAVTTANGVSATVANATTTPNLTFTLGAITPSSVAASGTVTGSNLSGTNTGDQTITLTGDVTGSGTSSFAATIANDAVTYAKMQNVPTQTVVGRGASGTGDLTSLTLGAGLTLSAGGVLDSVSGGSGTVTSVSVVTANGVSGSVANATTTPAITLTLGAITPTSVAASGTVTGSNLSGTNTGNVTLATFGSTPANEGASISGQALTLQPADATHGGGISTATQTIAGAKTLNAGLRIPAGQVIRLDAVGAAHDFFYLAPDIVTDSNLCPTISGTDTLGSSTLHWLNTYTDTLSVGVSGTITDDGTSTTITHPAITPTVTTTAATALDCSSTSAGVILADATDANTSPSVAAMTFRESQALTAGDLAFQFQANTAANLCKLSNIGDWTCVGNIAASGTISGSNFSGSSSGTNTGNVTLTTFGSTPNANGASLSGQVLNLQPADGSNPGGVSTTTQTFAGAKTFSTPIALGSGGTNASLSATAGAVIFSTASAFSKTAAGTSGQCLQSAGTGTPTWGACQAATPASWSAYCPGFASVSCGTDTIFLGPSKHVKGAITGITCNHLIAGTAVGENVMTMQIVADPLGTPTELCSCTASCTTASRVPYQCACSGTFVSGTDYVLKIKSGSSCTTNPTDIYCNVEYLSTP